MKKIIVSITTVVVVGFGSAFFSNSVHADNVNDLQKRQTEVKSEREEVKQSLSKAEAEIADILFDLKELNEEIKKVDNALKENNSMMKKANKEIEKSEEEIKTLEEEISQLEDTIEVRNEILKSRIASMQKAGGNIGFIEVIFGSKSFGEFISRATSASKVTNADSEIIKQQEKDKEKVEKQRTVYQTKLDEQTELKVELKGMQEVIVAQKEENDSSKKQLQEKEQELVTMKVELQTKDSSLASLESQIRQDITAINTPVVATNNSSTTNDNLTTLSDKTPKQSNKAASTPAPAASSGNGNMSTVINAGYPHLGTPYVWAGKGPGGFDCSGFVSWAYGQGGYSIPSSTGGLASTGQKVSYSSIQPGDLVFFNTYKTNGHVGIYIGGGKFIGAQSSDGVSIRSMSESYWNDRFTGHVRRVQ